jgi:hypothetical protein
MLSFSVIFCHFLSFSVLSTKVKKNKSMVPTGMFTTPPVARAPLKPPALRQRVVTEKTAHTKTRRKLVFDYCEDDSPQMEESAGPTVASGPEE